MSEFVSKDKKLNALPFQKSDMEKKFYELINEKNLVVTKENTKSFVKTLSIQENMIYQPRAIVLVLNLKIIMQPKLNSLLKHGFGVLRGVFKDYQRKKSGFSANKPRRSVERSENIEYETPAVNELGDLIYKTTRYHKKIVVKTRTRPNSPFSYENIHQGKNQSFENLKKANNHAENLLKCVNFIIKKSLKNHFHHFKRLCTSKIYKNTNFAKVFENLCLKTIKNWFGSLKEYQNSLSRSSFLSKAPLIKVSSFLSEDSKIRSPSFIEKDKEL